MQIPHYKLKHGSPYPLGAKYVAHDIHNMRRHDDGSPYAYKGGGVNFSIFSRHASSVDLLLFESSECEHPFQVITLEKEKNRTFFSWHVFVKELPIGTWYCWRLDGLNQPRESGLRFDKQKYLLDPWARAVSNKRWKRGSACIPGDNGNTAMRCMVVDEDYNWDGDKLLAIRSERAIVYELHVGGFTRHPSANVNNPGTFAGLIEKIPYLQELGITHVELLPIMAFDEQDVPGHTADLGLKNYWGYSTHSFFSPHPGFCVTPEQGTHLDEFRDLVKALHKAGIAIILDVVFNHTSEAGTNGPLINFKGILGDIFYHLDPNDKSIFYDYTGCGNTVNANHPLVSRFIISCLEYWVREMHVDGFRFDLASALARGEGGAVLNNPPVLWGIELSEQLAKTKLIAEAWDAAGLYQVGSFPGYRWAEWNGRYRDVIRRFLRGEKGIVREVATRICGSSDLYESQGRLPISGINFITCHDGFTLYDLFSYNQKHNEANGESNRDGCSNNLSCNSGVEGDTDDVEIIALRRKQTKNAFAILLLSQGVPMIYAGDEFLNTQKGNNNGYCQDNELSWLDWNMAQQNADMLRFVQQMIAFRKRHHALMRRRFLTGNPAEHKLLPDIYWHGPIAHSTPCWHDPESRKLIFTLAGIEHDEPDLHIVMNMSDEQKLIELPLIEGKCWCLALDTSRPSPNDIVLREQQHALNDSHYNVDPKSVVVFENITI
ncbi:MAG: glycogen debranching protein GlgX [Methylovulum sp.]|jgi:glycogen operon protein|nr:glycogen debranching protein GlgX [Methylovulum sp.]MCF7998957.1 glycogen debranching protein GlgX [Methylovulum sp.]